MSNILDVNTICRRSWYIAAHIWKIYDFKIEVVPFIINFSIELTTVVKFEVYVQKWCGRSCICGLFNFQRWRIYQWKKFYLKIINFPNMCSNIPASPAYGVYISQLICYRRASSNYSDFQKRHLYLRKQATGPGLWKDSPYSIS
jgi:hypothetical protein